jgi:hypothetical protein
MTQEIPEVLSGVLRKGDYVESLEAIRDRLARELDGLECETCGRQGPRDAKDVAALMLRLTDVLGKLREAQGGSGAGTGAPVTAPDAPRLRSVASIQERARERRTGAGTQTTGAPTSVAKRHTNRRSSGTR